MIQQGSEPTLKTTAVSKEVTYPFIAKQRTLTPVRRQKRFQSALRKFQCFAGSLWVVLRPKCPAGLIDLAQCPCPRETRCKTSCAKRLINLTFILYFKSKQGPRGWSPKGYLRKSKQPISPTLAAGDRTVIPIWTWLRIYYTHGVEPTTIMTERNMHTRKGITMWPPFYVRIFLSTKSRKIWAELCFLFDFTIIWILLKYKTLIIY